MLRVPTASASCLSYLSAHTPSPNPSTNSKQRTRERTKTKTYWDVTSAASAPRDHSIPQSPISTHIPYDQTTPSPHSTNRPSTSTSTPPSPRPPPLESPTFHIHILIPILRDGDRGRTYLQHVQQRRLARVVEAQEQQLGVLVQEAEGGEDVVD